MKTRLATAFAIVAFCFTAASGCKGKESAVGPNACEAAGQKSQAFVDAAQVYAADPNNTAKCQAYKKAATEFVNAADKCSSIPQADINDAKDEINSITCP